MRLMRMCLVLGVALACSDARAEDTELAKAKYEEGTKLYNLGEFKGAAEAYRAAYMAKSDPVILYNIGQAYRFAGDAVQALFFYRSYLRNSPTAPNRREVEERIAALEKQQQILSQPPSGPLPIAPPQAAAAPTP